MTAAPGWAACAALVERGDPERFLAAMAAPPAARAVLFPLYAFNVEVSRAPWLTEEPMIAEMRLQWWRDALEEIAGGGPVRAHEVTTELARVLDPEAARGLDRLVAARRWDAYRDPFEDLAQFDDYIDATAAELMWQAVRLLGGRALAEREARAAGASGDGAASARAAVRKLGRAAGLARFLAAVPTLEARGRVPLVDGRPEAVGALAEAALDGLGRWAALARAVPPRSRPGMLEGWLARPILSQAARAPRRVADGSLGISPFRSKLRLMRWALPGSG